MDKILELNELIKIYNMEKPRGKKLTVTTIYGNVLGHPASSSNQAVKDLLTSNSFKFSEKPSISILLAITISFF